MRFDDYADWLRSRYLEGRYPTPEEDALWLANHPFDDKKDYFSFLQIAYERVFHAPMGLILGYIETYEDACDVMAECIRSGKRFSDNLPKGCVR